MKLKLFGFVIDIKVSRPPKCNMLIGESAMKAYAVEDERSPYQIYEEITPELEKYFNETFEPLFEKVKREALLGFYPKKGDINE